MGVLVADGFKQYTGVDEIKAKLARVANQIDPIMDPAGPFGKYSVSPRTSTNAVYHYGAMRFPRPGENAPEICASVDAKFGTPAGSGAAKFAFAVSPSSWDAFNITPTGTIGAAAMVGAIMVEIDNLVPTVYHSVVTAVNASTGAPTANKMALGVFPTLVSGNSYTIEIRARIISATSGEATVRINGEEATFSFNPTRVSAAAGLEQTSGFGIAMLGSGSSTSPSVYVSVSDVVIYDNDTATPWPLGAVDITYLAADDPDLAVGPASDLTYETISSETVYQIADPAAGADIVGGVAYARIAAVGGSVATRAQLELVNAGQTVTVADQVINPGYVSTIKSVPVSKEMISAGSVFRARSVTP